MKKVIIEYCVVCNYYDRAASLASKIKEHLEVEIELQKSSGGRFEVFLEGKQIFSKIATMRFPSPEEIIKILFVLTGILY